MISVVQNIVKSQDHKMSLTCIAWPITCLGTAIPWGMDTRCFEGNFIPISLTVILTDDTASLFATY